MPQFILNKDPQAVSHDHEVHNATAGCTYMPAPKNQIDLGNHPTCHSAVSEGKKRRPEWKINGCYHCCNECHTG